jgi:hypothetical protein
MVPAGSTAEAAKVKVALPAQVSGVGVTVNEKAKRDIGANNIPTTENKNFNLVISNYICKKF